MSEEEPDITVEKEPIKERVVGEQESRTVKYLKCDSCGFTESLYAFEVEERNCTLCGGTMKPVE